MEFSSADRVTPEQRAREKSRLGLVLVLAMAGLFLSMEGWAAVEPFQPSGSVPALHPQKEEDSSLRFAWPPTERTDGAFQEDTASLNSRDQLVGQLTQARESSPPGTKSDTPSMAEAPSDRDPDSVEFFPSLPLFKPLIADPKQPRFFASIYRYDSNVDRFTMASVGFGENFGLLRWGDLATESAWQLSLEAGAFSQFNLDAPSDDLLNTDFNIGFPLAFRYGSFSMRFHLYHQSSHLGDELLLRADPDRINLSFESFETLLSYEFGGWRLYGGGEYLIRREPDDLKRGIAHAGLEYRGLAPVGDLGGLVGGIDVQAMEEHDWSTDISVKLGLQLQRPNPSNRRIRLLLEGFKGHSPYGQFFRDRIAYYGIGLFFGF